MGKTSDSKAATLMAAVSVIALSVGMSSAQAEDSNKSDYSAQHKGDSAYMKYEKHNSSQIKIDSNQQKGDAHYLKYESSQVKGQSSQLKLDSQQVKGGTMQNSNSVQNKKNSVGFNPQPDPPGDSVQQKGTSMQQKTNAGQSGPSN